MLGRETIKTESILLRSDYDTPSHSAWSESSAARLRPRGGHRKGKKLAPSAFATLERRGPKGRADALAVIVLWRKEDQAARPVGPSRRDRFWWRLIKNAINFLSLVSYSTSIVIAGLRRLLLAVLM